MAPVVRILAESPLVQSFVCVTAQHRDLLDSVMGIFGIEPDFDLDIMTVGQDLAEITTKSLNGLTSVISDCQPDLVLVHGDTTTTMAAGLAAFYSQVPIGHVEAGLRTHDKYAPFPEEINRRIAGVVADLHFAPTKDAKDNLLKENVPCDRIFVTGNTAIDAIDGMVSQSHIFKVDLLNQLDFAGKRIITMTAHRRENHGKPLEDICKAVLAIKRDFDNVEIVFPVHPSPVVCENAYKILGNTPGIYLTEPVDVDDMHNLLSKSYLVLTDSGGLQEEAPHHNVPVVVLRNVTERPEGVDAGCLVLAGNTEKSVYDAVYKLLMDDDLHKRMSLVQNPFGDGQASGRILKAILEYFRK